MVVNHAPCFNVSDNNHPVQTAKYLSPNFYYLSVIGKNNYSLIYHNLNFIIHEVKNELIATGIFLQENQ